MGFLCREWQLLLSALMFYTKIPLPFRVDYEESSLNRATRYLPIIGAVVGIMAAVVYLAAAMIWPVQVSVWLSMAVGIILTGAFHEDGFADACDGFGGGWQSHRILDIMKDSRVGAFGAFGAIFMLSGKFLALSSIATAGGFYLAAVLVAGHSLSRWGAVILVWRSSYARANEDGKAKPLATSFSNTSFAIATILAIVPLALLPLFTALAGLAAVVMVAEIARRYFERWIGGYTGDCLGAVQQLGELVFYLVVLAGCPSMAAYQMFIC